MILFLFHAEMVYATMHKYMFKHDIALEIHFN